MGTIDSARAAQILETLLDGIMTYEAAVALVDITGVRGMDELGIGALLKAAKAARLLGTQLILTGIAPPVARTLTETGADLGGVITHGSLQAGVTYALGRSARQRVRPAKPVDDERPPETVRR
ncbi:STAS domain-containing protein [Sorangium sp. So ce1099]|uniref:STAS domain-containing protein n=1 Tax=Sorangium sp. So ce1099 TaxID=3133331 RepID=UPI003F6288E0